MVVAEGSQGRGAAWVESARLEVGFVDMVVLGPKSVLPAQALWEHNNYSQLVHYK